MGKIDINITEAYKDNKKSDKKTPTKPASKNKEIKTILTHRGYAIVKEQYGFRDINRTKKELTVSPFVNDGYAAKAVPFPIYLESDKKLFLPKHYGFENFGKPDKIKNIDSGLDIDIEFNGTLRPAQQAPINAFMKSCETGKSGINSNGGIISIGCGGGKCLKVDTPIMMSNGTIKRVQDIRVGDKLMGDDSKPRNVLSLARGQEQMYEIIPSNGDPYTVNESHILSLKYKKARGEVKKGTKVDISVAEYLTLPQPYQGVNSPLVGYRVPVIFPYRKIDIEPYALGYWLGGEYSSGPFISISDNNIISYFRKFTSCLRLHFTELPTTKYDTSQPITYKISPNPTYIKGVLHSSKDNTFMTMLNRYGLIMNKHIPEIYKCNSRGIQINLLAGIIDSLGRITNNKYYIVSHNKRLIDDIAFVARSLGFGCITKVLNNTSKAVLNNKRYRLVIYGANLYEIPVKSIRNKTSIIETSKDALITEIRVVKKGIDNYYGFEIDGNRRFLLGDTTVTHNTVLGLYLTAKLKKKTLIIVHKEFLINQWKERIEQFLPSARVGVIQASKIDIKNKEIVIGMLQSLSMKEYPWEMFDEFGFTIIDECFPANTPIVTDKGLTNIGSLFDLWNINGDLPKVLSYNSSNDIFEFKPLTYAWKKTSTDLIQIKFGKRTITCTPNHRILTTKGYKQASLLNSNSLIISRYSDPNKGFVTAALNNDQLQFVYGSYLANKNLYIDKYKRYYLKIEDPHTQHEYCFWKATLFNRIGNIKFIDNSYTRKSIFKFNTRCFDLDIDEEVDNRFIEYIINKLDLRGIAIWFMECGFYQEVNSTASISLPLCDIRTMECIMCLFEKFNISTKIHLNSPDKYIAIFTRHNIDRLFSLISPYIHNTMRYKIPSGYKCGTYNWSTTFLGHGTLPVLETKYIKNTLNDKKQFVYDIEIKDNHNFVIGKRRSDGSEELNGPVVSNCHHIGAEVFSRALPKVNSKYSLGLSATPKRKDGLSKVFHWFLGPTLFENKVREGLLPIHVNIAMYNCTDESYSKMELTGFGKICMSRMVNNITEFSRRTELIINIVKNLRSIGKKILILSDRRAHLTEIYNIITEREIATIGYYVGGMKQKDLKDSEGKDVLLGTYTMSSEGMDIPDLDAVIFASPRSDIIQSIGRIMRKKHETNPICWDIVDNFSVFPRQYEKRRAYYRKMNYPIKIYEIEDTITEPLDSMLNQLNSIPKDDVKKTKKKSQENIILKDYNFIED